MPDILVHLYKPAGYHAVKNLSTGRKAYFALVKTGTPAHFRRSKRGFRTATDAQLYAAAIVRRHTQLILARGKEGIHETEEVSSH